DASGFGGRRQQLTDTEITACLRWLAAFHALFMHEAPVGLWEVGTYWHLATRPDERAAMQDLELRHAADAIDRTLNSASHQTIVHGDAKVANFCFASDRGAVAAVDFQYVGASAGV